MGNRFREKTNPTQLETTQKIDNNALVLTSRHFPELVAKKEKRNTHVKRKV